MSVADGGAAYPREASGKTEAQTGMTLRDFFAGQAAVGVASREGGEQDAKVVATRCYQIADALLKAREERR